MYGAPAEFFSICTAENRRRVYRGTGSSCVAVTVTVTELTGRGAGVDRPISPPLHATPVNTIADNNMDLRIPSSF
jgi:hypothetical protein